MKIMKHRYFTVFLSLLLAVCLLMQACTNPSQTPNQTQSSSSDTNHCEKFAAFTDSLFRDSISSDALSLAYTLATPETYGVTPEAGGFNPISYEALKASAPETENLLSSLSSYDKDSLSLPQKVLYDSLEYTLKMDLRGNDYLLFTRPLSPVTGMQAQLPVLLAEYSFDSEYDIQNYFALLRSIPEYFTSVLSFMELQARESMLPCRDTIEGIASQCLSFLENNGTKILISSFNRRIKSCDFYGQTIQKTLRKENRKLVQNTIVPAYQQLIDGLNVLSAMCGSDGSLCSYKNGKEYYSYLFACETGSDTSVETYLELLNDRLTKSKQTLLNYAKKDPSILSGLHRTSMSKNTPEVQLKMLSQAIVADFPKASDVNFSVSYVDKSLEDYLSPAFYLTPPLDAFTENAIYINNSSRFAGADLSATLAHEGYPGHLYQNVYFRQLNRPLLSYALNFSGYTEGWATYAEAYSYKYLGYTKDEVGILRNNTIISLCIYAICDIGIHYFGWGEDKVLSFLNENGAYAADTAHSLYTNIIDEPGSYLKYSIGYMEFLRLKDLVRTHMGTQYSEMAFHTYVLSAGPAPFPVLKTYMEEFLSD